MPMATSPRTARKGLVPLRSTAAVRIAAIGRTRAARIAGMAADTTVTMVPTITTSTTRSGCTCERDRAGPHEVGHDRHRLAEQQEQPDAGQHADHAGHDPDDERLEHDRPSQLRPASTDGPQQGELADPLGHDDREGVVDDEDADEQGHVGEDLEHRAEHAGDVGHLAGRLLAEVVARAHEVARADPLLDRRGEGLLGGARVGLDVDGVVGGGAAVEEGERVLPAHDDVAVGCWTRARCRSG